MDVIASEPSLIFRLKIDKLFELLSKHSDLQMNLYRLAGSLVRQIVMVDRTKPQPAAVGVIHQSSASRPLTRRLVQRLMEIEDAPCVASDVAEWKSIDGVAFGQLYENGQLVSQEQNQSLLQQWSNRGRVFVDISADHGQDDLIRLMGFADTLLWCVCPHDVEPAIRALKALHAKVAGWRDKTRLVWLLDGESPTAPHIPELAGLVVQDFKISFSKPREDQGGLLSFGVERIIHHLRGVQIGIALGGGAARGMAHLGVLEALEKNGIFVDMIAGTSAGAMTGTLYASGMGIRHTIESFENDLRLPWLFRRLPGGGYWYLVYKYRRRQFDPMLRRHLGELRLEQMPLPMLTVTVDLVKGGPVVRDTGDATKGILESINLPGLSSPIVRNGQALVDGGLVNNIPADVLVEKGCNFVLASSVTAKLEPEFSGIRSGSPINQHRSPSVMQVIMRGYLVQSHNMNSVGVQPADFVIEPDVTGFDLPEFSRTGEMSEIGARTTEESIGQIKQLLSKLDPMLFPS